MKKMILCCLFFLSGAAMVTQVSAADPAPLSRWSVRNTWQFEYQPIDFSQSLDGRWIFILGNDSKVHVYSADGNEKGSIPVAAQTVALDIEPRGKTLYIIDKSRTYIAVNISFSPGSLDWSIQNTWKTESVPLSFAHEKSTGQVYILEEDSAVHIYSFSGQSIGSIPVTPGTVAVDLIPRKQMLYLVDQYNTYKALKIYL